MLAARRAISVVFCASGFDTGVWASQLPRVKSAMSLSDSGLASVVLSFAIGAILTMPVTGALATRIGGVRAVLATGLASALALALLGLATRYPVLLAAALLAGMALGGLDVAMNTQAGLVERACDRPIMSGVHGWFSVGGLAGASAGGALTVAAFSVRGVLLIAATIELLAATVSANWLGVASERTDGPALAWPRRATLGIGLLCLLAFLIEGAVFDWTSVYMHEVAGASLGFAPAGFGGFSLAMAATRFVGDRASHRWGRRRVLTLGAGLVAFGIALACAVPRPLVVTAGLTLAGFGEANIVPLLFSAAGRVPGVAPGAGVAMAATMGYGAFLFGPPVIGVLADAAGLRSALLLPALCGLAIAGGATAFLPPSPADES